MPSIPLRSCIRWALILALGGVSIGCSFAGQQAMLVVNGQQVTAAVAATFAQREQGLMGRRNLARNEGMLFVFPRAALHAMWMKNTLIPLDVAFIDQNGSIINIETMAAASLRRHSAKRPAKYALEMSAGWFHDNGVSPGEPVQGLAQSENGP